MSHPKVHLYRHCVNEIRSQYKMTTMDFEIVLFASEQDMVHQYLLWKYISTSKGSVKNSLTYLTKKGFIKQVRIARRGKGGMPAAYAITGKGRAMVTDFYMKLFPSNINY